MIIKTDIHTGHADLDCKMESLVYSSNIRDTTTQMSFVSRQKLEHVIEKLQKHVFHNAITKSIKLN